MAMRYLNLEDFQFQNIFQEIQWFYFLPSPVPLLVTFEVYEIQHAPK
jgi:hypothetical protein